MTTALIASGIGLAGLVLVWLIVRWTIDLGRRLERGEEAQRELSELRKAVDAGNVARDVAGRVDDELRAQGAREVSLAIRPGV